MHICWLNSKLCQLIQETNEYLTGEIQPANSRVFVKAAKIRSHQPRDGCVEENIPLTLLIRGQNGQEQVVSTPFTTGFSPKV